MPSSPEEVDGAIEGDILRARVFSTRWDSEPAEQIRSKTAGPPPLFHSLNVSTPFAAEDIENPHTT